MSDASNTYNPATIMPERLGGAVYLFEPRLLTTAVGNKKKTSADWSRRFPSGVTTLLWGEQGANDADTQTLPRRMSRVTPQFSRF